MVGKNRWETCPQLNQLSLEFLVDHILLASRPVRALLFYVSTLQLFLIGHATWLLEFWFPSKVVPAPPALECRVLTTALQEVSNTKF